MDPYKWNLIRPLEYKFLLSKITNQLLENSLRTYDVTYLRNNLPKTI